MRLLSERRAQSIQVGAVLLFGILIIVLSLYQAFVVPNQNEAIEFDHNQDVQEQLTEVRSAANSMPDSETTRSVSVDLGVEYPSRSIFVNPGPASGTLRTVGTTNDSVVAVIDNAVATGGTGDFWDGTDRAYNTGALEYRPNYNLYSNAPWTVYEHSVLYNTFEREVETLPLTDQAIVDGNRLTLVALNGSMSETRVGAVALDLLPTSTQTRTVTVENGSDSYLSLTLPTGLDAADWRDLLSGEDRVHNVTDGPDGTVVIRFEPGTYDLQLAKVGVGTGVTRPDEAYLTDEPNDVDGLNEGETDTLVVEVRDEYNRPVRGVTVHADAGTGDLANNTTVTNAEGQARFVYTAPSGDAEDDIQFSYRGAIADIVYDDSRPQDETVTVDVRPGGTGGGTYELAFKPARISEQNGIDCVAADSACTMTIGASPALLVGTTPNVTDATVDFSLSSGAPAFLVPSTNETDDAGETSTEFRATDDAGDGDEVVVHANSAGGGDTLAITLESGTFFDVQIDETDSDTSVTEGDTATVVADIENLGDQDGNQTIEFEVTDATGTVVHTDSQDGVALASGDSQRVSFDWVTNTTAPGEYTATVRSDDDADTLDIVVASATAPFFDVTILGTNDPVPEGDVVTVDVDVANNGGTAGTQTITLRYDDTGDGVAGTVADSQSVELAAGASTTITLEWATGTNDGGTNIPINVSSEDDFDTDTVTVWQAFYPDRYTENQGTLTNFPNMQAPDGTVAEFRGQGSNSFDIDVHTDSLPAGDYTLEVGVDTVDLQGSQGNQGSSDGIDVVAKDESGAILGSATLRNGDSNTQLSISLRSLESQQTVTIEYLADMPNDQLDVDYQRLIKTG